MKNSIVLVEQFRNELLIYVIPDAKKKKNGYTHMRFPLSDSSVAIYHAIKKASSLRYDYGYDSVKIEINGLPSTEMSVVESTKLVIK